MIEDVFKAAGGLGLFLLGMVTMSDGLRAMAGVAIRRALRRFTRSPTSGAVTGTLTTAIIQSSSITTVSAVGFASAGLLTFPEALGIVFGANIGTTVTGWLVALLGFKLKLGTTMPLVVLSGVLIRIFGRIAASEENAARRAAALHVIDQLRRLLAREAQEERVTTTSRAPELAAVAQGLAASLPAVMPEQGPPGSETELADCCATLEAGRPEHRDSVARRVADGSLDADRALALMDAYRWIERVAHHAWRITHHLIQLGRETPSGILVEPAEPD